MPPSMTEMHTMGRNFHLLRRRLGLQSRAVLDQVKDTSIKGTPLEEFAGETPCKETPGLMYPYDLVQWRHLMMRRRGVVLGRSVLDQGADMDPKGGPPK